MKSITEMTKDEAGAIRFVLTDIDDTLTTRGKLSSQAYQARPLRSTSLLLKEAASSLLKPQDHTGVYLPCIRAHHRQ
ncbi:MAG: hypothetical protein LBB43_05615, partial [Spirochaetaceae bacterium]|nr:hypothetical protein [Spirochaetaceae bacterium]